MHKYKKLIPVVAVILVALGVNLEQFGIDLGALTGQSSSSQSINQSTDCSSNQASASQGKLPHWSKSSPEINMWHVFEGEINKRGKPTGYHSRPCGRDPANARVVSVKDKPNKAGVYTANIEVRDGGQWKSKFSSFFPDNLSQQEVVDVIVNAYNKSKNPKKQPWSGPSGLGFEVQGYTSNRGGINTAFPVFKRNQ